MKTLARPPLLTTTTGSTAFGVLVLQLGSSLMSILGLAGAAPVNLTVPVTAPCAWADAAARNIEQVIPSNTRLMIPPKSLSARQLAALLLSSPYRHVTESRR